MNKLTAKISKLEHRGGIHLKVDIPFSDQAKQLIKSIKGRKFSRTHRCWYIPDTLEALEALKQHFEVETLQPLNQIKDEREKGTSQKTSNTQKKLQSQQQGNRTFEVFTGNKVLLEAHTQKWIRAFVPYDKKGWIEIVRNIVGRKWDVEGGYWLLPNVKDTYQQLWKLVGKECIELTFQLDASIPQSATIGTKRKTKKPKFSLNQFQKKAIIAFEEKLLLEHKAWRTIKTYKGLFIHFLAHFPNTKPSQISKAQIERYLVYKKQDNISDSQMNQLINVLNCFFIRILKQEEKVVKLERPKKKKKLPNVFSLEEIEMLIKACENLKHKCMLMLIYSGGLRRSELLNLRVEDLNFNRKTIFVKNAKGGKDRFTFFAESAQKYVREYLKQYKPRYYLFEGQVGGRYGESSLQKIFDVAKKKSKVTPNVTIHGLRHSFATHLIEKRVPLHIVQDMLGHNSIKTTEIYLHISNKFRKELKSPLDDLEI